MNSNPAVPGGLLTSKPAWSNTFKCSTTPAFFVPLARPRHPRSRFRVSYFALRGSSGKCTEDKSYGRGCAGSSYSLHFWPLASYHRRGANSCDTEKDESQLLKGTYAMQRSILSLAQQVALAAGAFEH
jgi:hypothetical protein